jgi:hypothetical protein
MDRSLFLAQDLEPVGEQIKHAGRQRRAARNGDKVTGV